MRSTLHSPARFVLLALLVAAALSAAATGAAAQEPRARLRVMVSDSAGNPVAGAVIVVSGLQSAVPSDSTGEALVTEIPLGTRMVTVRHLAYAEERALLQFPSENTFRLRVVLTPQALALDTLRVREQYSRNLNVNGFYRRREQGIGRYIAGPQMERVTEWSPNLAPVFRMLPGFRVVPGRPGMPFILQSTRGDATASWSSCTPTIWIGRRRSDMEELAGIAPQHVEAIEAYSGASNVPAEFSFGQNQCGVVVVWLRT